MAALLAVSTISFVVLALLPGHVSTESGLWLRVCLVFTGGTGIGAAYYIPAGMFSTKYGGDHAGVLSCYLDATSFLASALFIKLLGVESQATAEAMLRHLDALSRSSEASASNCIWSSVSSSTIGLVGSCSGLGLGLELGLRC